MSKLLVFGHQNLDMMQLHQQFLYAFLLRQLGEDAVAVALGTLMKKHNALNYFKEEVL